MKTELQKIGHAHAVIIPEAFLTSCGIGQTLNVRLENNRIVLEAITAPRVGWFDTYEAELDSDVWQGLSPDTDTEDWQW